MPIIKDSKKRVGRICSLPLGLVIIWFGWWWTMPPLYAHSIEDEATVAVELPPRFVARTVVSGLTLPTDMVILPSGDLLVTEKGVGFEEVATAQVRLVRQGVLQPEPVLTLNVNEKYDSGLYSIILDPEFSVNHYFYLWYSTGENSLGWNGTTVNRLSRFTYNEASGKAVADSETLILDNILWSPLHNGGGLAFDAAGNLLVTTGDAASGYTMLASNLAQDISSFNGKVLRIKPKAEGGYAIPLDNPYINSGYGALPELYGLGLRNPFRMTQRAADQKFYFIDVGQDSWEEVNELMTGVNYGWPYREGRCPLFNTDDNCPPAPSEYTDPIFDYAHPPEGAAGITAMAFYEGTAWPEQYHGRLFFADFNSNWVGMVDLDDPTKPVTQFASGISSLVDMQATPEGMYAVSIYEGRIYFIYYAENGNLPPTVLLQATPITGTAPLMVEFAATNAHDEDGDILSYHWDFGDGSEVMTTTAPTMTHLYTQDGDYLATLQVQDGRGGGSEIVPQEIQVYSGALAQIVQENVTEPGRVLYHGGDEIRFLVTREGGTTGLDPVAPYVWTVLLHHNEHIHSYISAAVGDEVTLQIPTLAHALGEPIWYEIQVAMHTASGQTLRTTHSLYPQIAQIEAQGWPGPTFITLDKELLAPNQPIVVTVGQTYVLEAAEMNIYERKVGQFKNWIVTESWPGAVVAGVAGETELVAERRLELVASTDSKTYVAFYEYTQPAYLNFLPSLSNQQALEVPE